MTKPIVYISHFKIKEGMLDRFKEFNREGAEKIRANKPGTVAFLSYLNEEGTELSIIHVFPDADSFDRHVEGVDERAKVAFEFIEPTRREVYGMPSERVSAMLRPPGGSEITFHSMPEHLAGYIRLKEV